MNSLSRRCRLGHRDAGTTLAELLVAVLLFGIVSSIAGTFIVAVVREQERTSGITTDLNQTRTVNNLLDNTLRFASAVNAPGTGTDGNYYVEWVRSDGTNGSTDNTSYCTQWRYNTSAHSLQQRTWTEVGGALSGSATSWRTEATQVYQDGSNAIWTRYPNSDGINNFERLRVDFLSKQGAPKQSLVNNFTLSAVNSGGLASASVSTWHATPVCQLVGRP